MTLERLKEVHQMVYTEYEAYSKKWSGNAPICNCIYHIYQTSDKCKEGELSQYRRALLKFLRSNQHLTSQYPTYFSIPNAHNSPWFSNNGERRVFLEAFTKHLEGLPHE